MGLLHASILSMMPDVEIVALVDKSTLLTRLFKKVFSPKGISVMNDFEKLSELSLDAAYITTPISSHSFIAKSLFKNETVNNMFVEKTLASEYTQAKELCDLANNRGSITMVGYMKRFSVVFRKAKDLLDSQIVGKPFSFKAYAYSSDFQGLTRESKSSASRGGALRDIGCHVVDLALWLLGDLNVCGVVPSADAKVNSGTSVSFNVRNPDGLTGQFSVSQSMFNYRMPEFGLSIDCSKGRIEVNDDRLFLTLGNAEKRKWYRADLNDTVDFFLGEPEYYRENRSFIDSILNEKVCEPNFGTGLKVDRLLDEVGKEALRFE